MADEAEREESEFLIGGRWVKLSAVPRAWLENEFLQALDRIHPMHADMNRLTAALDQIP